MNPPPLFIMLEEHYMMENCALVMINPRLTNVWRTKLAYRRLDWVLRCGESYNQGSISAIEYGIFTFNSLAFEDPQVGLPFQLGL